MEILKFDDVADKIITIRDEKVVLDSDVAMLYGVETMRINEAVKNNPDKFPEGYVIELKKREKMELIENFDNPKVKFSPALPKAFTEKGLYMLATILKSPQATQTTLAIIEAFAQLRELQRTVAELSEAPDESQQKSLMQKGGDIIAEILGDELKTSDTETSIELNFAVLKFKHTIKRK
ncbi:MAG: ORF6N domain-containing protein [Rikenellaceae bacterium]|nr:ORF6N domain-containing protein [Rikenellaceae bacterium]MCL2693416.1 ORF6N domain-containing protein [Rikenellaceae bacterium]